MQKKEKEGGNQQQPYQLRLNQQIIKELTDSVIHMLYVVIFPHEMAGWIQRQDAAKQDQNQNEFRHNADKNIS